jgi:hypothetical protein
MHVLKGHYHSGGCLFVTTIPSHDLTCSSPNRVLPSHLKPLLDLSYETSNQVQTSVLAARVATSITEPNTYEEGIRLLTA